MKANIGGVMVEGTPEDIVELIAAAAKRFPAEPTPEPKLAPYNPEAVKKQIEACDKLAKGEDPGVVGKELAEKIARGKHRRFKQVVSFKLKALPYALKYRSIGEMCAANPSIPYKDLSVGGLYTPARYVWKQGEIVRDALAKQGITVEWFSRVDNNGRAILADFRNGDNGELQFGGEAK